MRSAVGLRSFEHTPAASRRLGLALALSAIIHGLIAGILVPDTPRRGAPSGTILPIVARLEPLQVAVVADPPAPDRVRPVTGQMARQRAAAADHGSRAPILDAVARPGAGAPALPQAPDPTYYRARDLDSYPRPLAPLEIVRLAEDGPGEVRLALLIDEGGIVRDITFEGSAAPRRVQEALRAALATTLFIPASKDGRAVRSRIVLSVSFAAARDR